MQALNIVVLVSGTGSNLKSIAKAIHDKRCNAHIVAVVSDQPEAAALAWAQDQNIPTAAVPFKKGDDRAAWNQSLANTVSSFKPDLVVLAGFMRLIGEPMLQTFQSRIINIHPSLLPAFPGAHAPKDALNAGVRISGCTVHIVNDGIDSGSILAQAAVPVLPNDTVETLHERIKHQEHQLLPAVIHALAQGKLSLVVPHIRDAQTETNLFLQSPFWTDI